MTGPESETVSIYKKRCSSDSANYRAKALLLHFRKIVESALDSEVREKYKSHSAQLGFQNSLSAETAILKTSRLESCVRQNISWEADSHPMKKTSEPTCFTDTPFYFSKLDQSEKSQIKLESQHYSRSTTRLSADPTDH